jgi:hypothetical protein
LSSSAFCREIPILVLKNLLQFNGVNHTLNLFILRGIRYLARIGINFASTTAEETS